MVFKSSKPHSDNFEAQRREQLKNLDRFVDSFMQLPPSGELIHEENSFSQQIDVKKYVKDAKNQ
jgi:hypothetical protein